jgi:glycosyltransferase involved in cell wall biosynthesis
VGDRALHVAVDGRELLGKPTGVGRYLSEILRVWAAMSDGPRVTVVVPESPAPAVTAIGDSLEWHVTASRSRGTRWEQTRLPRAISAIGPDVFLAPGNTAPLLTRYPMAAIIYDVSFFARPEWFSARDGLRRRVLTKAAARRSKAVVTISEFSRSEIARYLGVDGGRVTIAPPGAPPLRPEDGRARPPLVLYAGSLFNRRHPEDMLAAFRLVRDELPSARLVLVGDNRTRPHIDPLAIAAALGVSDAVEWRAYVDDATLDRLYDEAGAFLFLSDYEGFGITPLEMGPCASRPSRGRSPTRSCASSPIPPNVGACLRPAATGWRTTSGRRPQPPCWMSCGGSRRERACRPFRSPRR